MEAKFIKLYPENPQLSKIEEIVATLENGGLIIYPTDTVYGLGCNIFNTRAVEKVKQLKKEKGLSTNLAFICYDLSHLSHFTRNVSTPIFKLMKKTLPGPYTFILNSSSKVPKILNAKKKTIGIRIPDNNIPREIVKVMGNPIITTSISDQNNIVEYLTEPEFIYEKYRKLVDIVIDGGIGGTEPSTIIDCTGKEINVVREGKGSIFQYL